MFVEKISRIYCLCWRSFRVHNRCAFCRSCQRRSLLGAQAKKQRCGQKVTWFATAEGRRHRSEGGAIRAGKSQASNGIGSVESGDREIETHASERLKIIPFLFAYFVMHDTIFNVKFRVLLRNFKVFESLPSTSVITSHLLPSKKRQSLVLKYWLSAPKVWHIDYDYKSLRSQTIDLSFANPF